MIGAAKHLDKTVREQQKIIGDMREAIGELRGALGTVTRANRMFRGEGSDAIDRLGGAGGGKLPKLRLGRRPASITKSAGGVAPPEPIQQIMDLPDVVEVGGDVIKGYIQKALKK